MSARLHAAPVPLHELHTDARSEEKLLARIRLSAIRSLVLSGAVEHVLALNLSLTGDGLAVRFRGRRRRAYTNKSPVEFTVEGVRPWPGERQTQIPGR